MAPNSLLQFWLVFEQRDAHWMQNVASENNLAETSFVSPLPNANEELYSLTWYTPTKEVELCGHATLAAAAALYQSRRVPKQSKISFQTPHSGKLYAYLVGDIINLDFPATPSSEVELTHEELGHLMTSFQISKSDILYTGRSSYDLLVEIDSSTFIDLVRSSREVDYSSISMLGGRGVILTSRGENLVSLFADHKISACDFASRCFFPRYGVMEDSVTGSAHCCLAPYWSQIIGKTSMIAFQASQRGGVLYLEIASGRIIIGGNSKIIIQSEILDHDSLL